MAELAAAFELFRGGQFAEAKAQAMLLIARRPDDFWAQYLAAIASAFCSDIPEFEKYLTALEEQSHNGQQTVYLHYLQAWHAVMAGDTEKALWHYLQIADDPEGWLAKSLIKKFRKDKSIDNPAYHAADFIVLPGELPPRVRSKAQPINQAAATEGWQYKPKRRLFFPRLQLSAFSVRRFVVAVAIAAVLVGFLFWLKKARNMQPTVEIPELQIADSAAVMPVRGQNRPLYTYRTRDAIINDFEKAKKLLAERKVNQCRFLLLRLIESNADFQSREKARIFTGFIPDPPFLEFNDNIALRDLFNDTRARIGSVILVSGELRDAVERSGAATYHFVVREGDSEYLVQAFRDAKVTQEKLTNASARSPIQVYGRFRGLVGQQRTIYLEAIRIWR